MSDGDRELPEDRDPLNEVLVPVHTLPRIMAIRWEARQEIEVRAKVTDRAKSWDQDRLRRVAAALEQEHDSIPVDLNDISDAAINPILVRVLIRAAIRALYDILVDNTLRNQKKEAQERQEEERLDKMVPRERQEKFRGVDIERVERAMRTA